jgi:hypothetical protein
MHCAGRRRRRRAHAGELPQGIRLRHRLLRLSGLRLSLAISLLTLEVCIKRASISKIPGPYSQRMHIKKVLSVYLASIGHLDEAGMHAAAPPDRAASQPNINGAGTYCTGSSFDPPFLLSVRVRASSRKGKFGGHGRRRRQTPLVRLHRSPDASLASTRSVPAFPRSRAHVRRHAAAPTAHEAATGHITGAWG